MIASDTTSSLGHVAFYRNDGTSGFVDVTSSVSTNVNPALAVPDGETYKLNDVVRLGESVPYDRARDLLHIATSGLSAAFDLSTS